MPQGKSMTDLQSYNKQKKLKGFNTERTYSKRKYI